MKPRRRKPQEPLGLQLFQSPPSDEHGLPLDELTQAYAELIARGDDPYTPLPDPDAGPAALLADEDLDEGEESADDAADSSEPTEPADREAKCEAECEVSPRTILEAMLFVGHPENQPLTSEKVASLMRGVRAHEIDELVVELNRAYDEEGCPYRIESVGAGYRLGLRDEFHSLRDVFYGRVKAAKLSQAAVDVLAIVAYKQPLSREDVDALRGRPSGSLLAQLVRRQLLRVERSHEQPRTPRFCTTDRFLQLFGLQGLRDLPLIPD
jgi:segregation and condensation protein B